MSRPRILQVLCLTGAAVLGTGSGAIADPPAGRHDPGVERAEGSFTVAVTPPFQLEPKGANCELTVAGELTFSGTLDGTAVGTTTALILASCAEAAAAPPGTYPDVFRFHGEFRGTVGETSVTDAELVYAGTTRAGGAIDATIRLFDDGAVATLRADAQVLVGGRYDGVVRD